MSSRTERQGNPILIVGGGVAGIVAALDLANASRTVHIVEQEPNLGGQVARLDKLYPTDHCAFCPLWTEVRLCWQHPLITVHTLSFIKDITQQDGLFHAVIIEEPHYIDEKRCIFCGRCEDKCAANAIRSVGEHTYPPYYVIDVETCNECGLCEDVCPTDAIDINREKKEIVVAVDNIIWATGFQDADISPLEEYGYGTHPDIMSGLEFVDWTAEAGPNKGTIITKHNRSVPKSIAFIQCAGARDMRMFPYCSAVCCMHALKQARWVKKRSPQTRCTIFFTDLRTVGKNYYEYALRAIDDGNLELIRGRPGLILPLPEKEGIGIKYENTMTQKIEIRKFDIVILNGALEPRLRQLNLGLKDRLSVDGYGFLAKEGNGVSSLACGFSLEPADVMESVIQASSAALKAIQKPRDER
jgi:heterodisulfide reductase subunit A